MEFRKATLMDVPALRALAGRSEAHWGYDEGFMEEFHRSFNVTEGFVSECPGYLACGEGGEPVAFWGLVHGPDDGWELEYFYVDEPALGKGYGRQMWDHMIRWCSDNGISEIRFVTSPQAVRFYEKMGAVQKGTVPSTIDGRLIPELVYQIKI